ncbi:hypothetical protein PHAVU_009G246600 [Phaseolus vulgaris]|uniref:Uncharacterized protein n=1 Tax=Phaseolus vulgaris TaxID=3885 RepID=V7AZA4_PHAVU|nr:hypothetical protein PHAVU_009G246600g [Phaseolus vulgaris]ESW10889.1 hypothetical protein PHAVU_009G246600g [Phaseolus vulgaris]
MFASKSFKSLLLLHSKRLTTPKPYFPFPSTLSLKHFSLTSQQHSLTVSYLINTFGFSPQTALKVSESVSFDTPQKPDSVIAFFTKNGFTDAHINTIVKRVPSILVCNPDKRLSPKFQFLLSKGASASDIVRLVHRCPRILGSSLKNNVIPSFELVRRFLQSDQKTIDCVFGNRPFLQYNVGVQNVNMLLDAGVLDSSIGYLFGRRPSILLSTNLREAIDEVKEMGFDPSKITFAIALHAKRVVSKSRWDAKVDAFKMWGWSEEMVLDSFRKHPLLMLASKDKINEVIRFWVVELGWDPLALAKMPKIFGFSLERRIVPRGLVLKHLIVKGLREKSAKLSTPFDVSEELFLKNYVMRFKEEVCELLKLYQEKISFQEHREGCVESAS